MAKKTFNFKKDATSLLFAMGARPPGFGEDLPFAYDASLQTPAGRLMLTVYDDWVAGMFEDVALAAKVVGRGSLNKHSGKWNWHYPKPCENDLLDLGRNFADLLVSSAVLEEFDAFSGEGPNTEFHYGYVDCANYKTRGVEVLAGRLSSEDIKLISKLSFNGRHHEFVPGQVGLLDLQGNEASMWIEDVDHAMHGIYSLAPTYAVPTIVGPSAPDLVKSFVVVACEGGWDEGHKPANYDEMRTNALAESEGE